MRVILFVLGLALLAAPAARAQRIVAPVEEAGRSPASLPIASVVETRAPRPEAEVRTEPARVETAHARAAAASSAKNLFAIIGLVVVVLALVAFLS